jgi:Na+/phosphate symporter
VAGLKAPNLNKWRFRRMLELQNAAMESRLENIGRMIEDIEISQRRKADRQARFSQQNEEAQHEQNEVVQMNVEHNRDAA